MSTIPRRRFPSIQRSGRKASASDPQMLVSRCMMPKWESTWVPGRTRMGEEPSGPPPRGRVVV
ncbi:hypothetical protein HO173_002293 [Letharia columbiana]|uniref:Uncharacterized protein n=1 Tax=Letharia columbiana TaxID=112416 RepID=A0A8H6G396_9LECA|nr:uncharacterized protein HO173_002293 [Letharia columbiana]KAF6239747.1 hypothetical protein HO173_002293 [Letharia columbiana]